MSGARWSRSSRQPGARHRIRDGAYDEQAQLAGTSVCLVNSPLPRARLGRVRVRSSSSRAPHGPSLLPGRPWPLPCPTTTHSTGMGPSLWCARHSAQAGRPRPGATHGLQDPCGVWRQQAPTPNCWPPALSYGCHKLSLIEASHLAVAGGGRTVRTPGRRRGTPAAGRAGLLQRRCSSRGAAACCHTSGAAPPRRHQWRNYILPSCCNTRPHIMS